MVVKISGSPTINGMLEPLIAHYPKIFCLLFFLCSVGAAELFFVVNESVGLFHIDSRPSVFIPIPIAITFTISRYIDVKAKYKQNEKNV